MSDALYLILILTLPVMGGIIAFMAGRSSVFKIYFVIPIATLIVSGLFAIRVFDKPVLIRWEWLPGIDLGWSIDAMSGLLILLVALISFLVHLFSAHYLSHDHGVHRYYGKLGFFTASMIGLLAADHFLLLFIFWELVGFSSYLLIGFWYHDNQKAKSAKEAFMVNRVADAGLLIGVILLIGELGQPFISELSGGGSSWPMQLAGFCLVIGALGKSAQFPFFGWLPKAMAGPTPVSALIHAATMVAAGVYLLVRAVPILTPEVMAVIAVIGAITAFMAAVAAVTQFDIKKVLAYSTISQLGYMIMGIGVGAYQSSLFHLWTHAFFKAGLFLCAGAVIHYFHALRKDDHSFDAQDMRNMGGLRSKLPITFYAFLICGFALSGLPLFSGFLSKEGILTVATVWASKGSWFHLMVPVLGLVTAVLTPYYVGRQISMVFFGESRSDQLAVPGMEPMLKVALPLGLLSIASVWFFHALSPLDANGWWLNTLLFEDSFRSDAGRLGVFVMVFSIIGAIGGLLVAYRKYGGSRTLSFPDPMSSLFSRISWNAWFLEDTYDYLSRGYLLICRGFYAFDKQVIDRSVNTLGLGAVVLSKALAIFDREIIDGVVNFTVWLSRSVGALLSRIQSGKVQNQLVWLILLLLLLIIWLQF